MRPSPTINDKSGRVQAHAPDVRSEEAILARAVGGDREAFAELVGMHERAVRAFLSRLLGDVHAADDVAQEVFIDCYRRLASYRGEGSFRGWLFAAARNRAVSLLRLLARRRTHAVADLEATLAEVRAGRAAEADLLAEEGLQAQLAACLAELPEKSRQLVEEHYTLGRSAESIARSLDRSGSAVRMALLRIRTALGTCIRRRLTATGEQPCTT